MAAKFPCEPVCPLFPWRVLRLPNARHTGLAGQTGDIGILVSELSGMKPPILPFYERLNHHQTP
jgi:hypothetical protein